MKFEILLKIYFSTNIDIDLSLRHIIADTIDERNWARVVEEGTGEGYFNIHLLIDELKIETYKVEITDLVEALGFLNYEFINIH